LSDSIPIVQVHDLRGRLTKALDAERWDEAEQISKAIYRLIPKCLSPHTCGTGTPHLDGVYSVGEMRLANSPASVKKSILHMNRILSSYKKSGKKKKKRE